MEITFAVLLWAVRIAFLVILYLFLIRAFGVLHRSMAAERAATRAAGALVVERSPARAPRVRERLTLRPTHAIGRRAGSDLRLRGEAACAPCAARDPRRGAVGRR